MRPRLFICRSFYYDENSFKEYLVNDRLTVRRFATKWIILIYHVCWLFYFLSSLFLYLQIFNFLFHELNFYRAVWLEIKINFNFTFM